MLVAKSNSDNFTYDGIDLGGERVAQEIEDRLRELKDEGHNIKKISVIGYSLGGLIARYTIGLLLSRGLFDTIQPMNFTTFASPHLGVRTPNRGYGSQVWNVLGSRTLSASGRQLFLIDSFRDTGRPLISILADSNSIFMQALSKFKHRTLYANIVNDRSAPYYTTGISSIDPFVDLDTVKIHYVKEYSPVILDPEQPVVKKALDVVPAFAQRALITSQSLLNQLPFFAALTVFVPIGSIAFLLNAGIQSVRSQQRIRLHEEGKAGIQVGSYRIPFMVENARSAMEGALEELNSERRPQYLQKSDKEGHRPSEVSGASDSSGDDEKAEDSPVATKYVTRRRSTFEKFPVLALTTEQFDMIDSLDAAGFKKYGVHIHNGSHSHAAIIMRRSGKRFEEGKVVAKHWLNEEFEL